MNNESLPERIGPYRVTGRLGRGGMGEVLRGYDDRLDRPVALKRVLPGGADPDQARQRFRREARVAARLSDSAIVQIYDWVEIEDGDWLVMELVDGKPLDEVLAEGPLGVEGSLRLAREIASGLAAAHDAGLVHRDLKPANVMLVAGEGSTPDRVKILDFGIAKPVEIEGGAPLSTLTAAGAIVGTVTAMSPEQALGQPVDHRSDLFALGSLLYEMLSGESPFMGDNNVATLSRICTLKQTALHRLDAEVPEALSDFVDRLLAKEPERRPADARQVVAELDRLSAAATVEPEVEKPSEAARQTTLIAEADPPRKESEDIELPDPEPSGGRIPRRWLAAATALLAAALWGLSAWIWPADKGTIDAGLTATAVPAAGTELDRHALFQRGMALLERYDKKGNIEEAIADFQRALAADENFAPALAGLSRAYWLDFYAGSFDPQRLEQALATARRSVDLDGYLAIARVALGMVHFEQGRTTEAQAEFEEALQLEPLNDLARFGLSRLYDSTGESSAAVAQIQQAIQVRPDRWYHSSWLGNLFFKMGRYPEAEAAFRRSLELTPDNFLSLRNLGVAHYVQGNLSEAASQFQNALQIQKDHSIYANLGTLYFAQGLYPESVSAFEKAIETGSGANAHVLWGNLGDAYRWTPDNETRAREAYLRAIQVLRERLAATPSDLTLQTRLAVYLAKRGDCDEARDEMSALDGAGDDANAWYRLAVANEVCSRRDAALSALERALATGIAIREVQVDPEMFELRKDVRYHPLTVRPRPTGGD